MEASTSNPYGSLTPAKSGDMTLIKIVIAAAIGCMISLVIYNVVVSRFFNKQVTAQKPTVRFNLPPPPPVKHDQGHMPASPSRQQRDFVPWDEVKQRFSAA